MKKGSIISTNKKSIRIKKPNKIERSVFKKLCKYIKPNEILLYEKEYGQIHKEYVLFVKEIMEWIEWQFEKVPIDKTILAYIIFELRIEYNRIEDDKIRRENRPYFYQGSQDLLEWINSKENKNFITQSIKIYNNIKDKSTNSRTIVKNIEVKGHELLSLFYEFAKKNKNKIQKLAIAEIENKRILKLPLYKDQRNYFKKKSAKILAKYFKDHLPGYGHNVICLNGGIVLHNIGFFHYRDNAKWDHPATNRARFISNFKSALRGK